MDRFLLSYHSLSVFTPMLLTGLMGLYLFLKPGKTRPTWWLAFTFAGFWVMFFGYFLAYSVFDPLGSFHRWMTIFVMFGQAALITFGYYYPRLDRPREARVVIVLFWALAVFAWCRFAYLSLALEPYYDFTAHLYSIHLGRVTSYFLLTFLVWWVIVFWRKTVRYSAEHTGNAHLRRPDRLLSVKGLGFFLARMFVGPYYVLRPRGKDAIGSRGFLLAGILMVSIAVFNTMNKTGAMSYETYAFLYSVLSLVTIFMMFMVYINNSPEPTTFMVKLVGISLFTLILVLGFVSDYALALNEESYNRERVSEVVSSRRTIAEGRFEELPGAVQYVLRLPKSARLFDDRAEIVWARANTIDEQSLDSGRKRMREAWLTLRTERVRTKQRSLKPEEALARVKTELSAQTEPVLPRELPPVTSLAQYRLYRDAGQFYTHFDFVAGNFRYEVGFSYLAYRQYLHRVALGFLYTIVLSTLAIVLLFPLFFRSSLVNPLNWLLNGVKRVNAGDLEVKVQIKDPDEIGFLARSFNSMVVSIREAHAKLEDYAHNLEEKVEERTREVREKMEEVHRLKVQQDGDYFLTSLLATPLFYNANKSDQISTQFLIQQKKTFEFREREGELGGDICVSGNLRLGKPNDFRRYTVAVNGDAMGKSMQGAGGALVMGVMLNSIMARSAAKDRVLDLTPQQWLTDVYNELHGVFRSFDGSMVISASIYVIEDQTGKVWYFNAEHPSTVLLRNGAASFIEEELRLRKLGLDSEFPFEVFTTKLEVGDVLILGSDGKDDINLTPGQETRTINEDEFLFLRFVERAGGDLEKIVDLVQEQGEITDDLSMLRVGYREAHMPARRTIMDSNVGQAAIEIDAYDTDEYYQHAKKLYESGDMEQALSVLQDGYAIDHSNKKLNKLLGLLSFKDKDYEKAVDVLNRYLEQDPELPSSLLMLSLAEKKLGNYEGALNAARRLHKLEPQNVRNLINLADILRLQGQSEEAETFAKEAERLEPNNASVRKLRELMGGSRRA